MLATTTYNGDIFPFMREFIDHLVERGFKKRTVAFIENGTWAPIAAKIMGQKLASCKELTFAETTVTVKSALSSANEQQLEALADELMR